MKLLKNSDYIPMIRSFNERMQPTFSGQVFVPRNDRMLRRQQQILRRWISSIGMKEYCKN